MQFEFKFNGEVKLLLIPETPLEIAMINDLMLRASKGASVSLTSGEKYAVELKVG